jgi:hypothetical protein
MESGAGLFTMQKSNVSDYQVQSISLYGILVIFLYYFYFNTLPFKEVRCVFTIFSRHSFLYSHIYRLRSSDPKPDGRQGQLAPGRPADI